MTKFKVIVEKNFSIDYILDEDTDSYIERAAEYVTEQVFHGNHNDQIDIHEARRLAQQAVVTALSQINLLYDLIALYEYPKGNA